jgi:hypothetical protein
VERRSGRGCGQAVERRSGWRNAPWSRTTPITITRPCFNAAVGEQPIRFQLRAPGHQKQRSSYHRSPIASAQIPRQRQPRCICFRLDATYLRADLSRSELTKSVRRKVNIVALPHPNFLRSYLFFGRIISVSSFSQEVEARSRRFEGERTAGPSPSPERRRMQQRRPACRRSPRATGVPSQCR